jgi:hypothetical protein
MPAAGLPAASFQAGAWAAVKSEPSRKAFRHVISGGQNGKLAQAGQPE